MTARARIYSGALDQRCPTAHGAWNVLTETAERMGVTIEAEVVQVDIDDKPEHILFTLDGQPFGEVQVLP